MTGLLLVSWRELWKSKKRLSLPGLALVIAVASLFVFQGLQSKVQEKLIAEGRAQLGADLRVRSLQAFPAAVREQIQDELPAGSRVLEYWRLNTMMSVEDRAQGQLVSLRAVDRGFPFYQKFIFSNDLSFDDLQTEEPLIFVPEDLAELLNLAVGDHLKIGDTAFKIGSIVREEIGGFGGFLSFAPSVWISRSHLEKTGLLERPGRIFRQLSIALPSEYDPVDIKEKIEARLDDPQYQTRAFNESNRGFQEVFGQVSLFAQLISVAALLLSGFTILGAFQNWFYDRRYLIAILRSLGAGRRQVRFIFFSAVGVFSTLCSLLGLVIGQLVFVGILPLGSRITNSELSSELSWSLYLFTFAVGIITPLLFSLFSFLDLSNYRPILLLRSQTTTTKWSSRRALLMLCILATFYTFNAVLLQSLATALYLTGGLLGALILGMILNWGLLSLFQAMSRWRLPLALQYALRTLTREKGASLLVATIFFALSFVLGAILHIEGNLTKAFQIEENVRQSNLFVFDVGETEKKAVDEALSKRPGAEINWAPWLALRWTSINGKPVEEVSDDDGLFRSEFLVTEISELAPQDRLIEGEIWDEAYPGEGLPELSVTREYFRQFGVGIGDRLGFELYGIAFEALVTSTRSVRWTDFQPGFRIAFQNGFFEGLPFSYLGAIETENSETRLEVRQDFARELPGVSLLDVTRIKTDLIRVMGEISSVIQGILFLLLLLGLVMIGVLTQEKISTRWLDFATLKCVGAKASWLRFVLALELSLTAFLPSVMGVFMGSQASLFFLDRFFNLQGDFQWSLQLYLPMGVLFVVLFIAWFQSKTVSRLRPRIVFQEMSFGRA